MVRKVLAAGVASGLLLFSGSSLFAHGGQYRGPSDTVPPNLGGGGDTTPPGNPGGPGTPGPGAPTTGGGRGPATGSGPVAPGAAAAGGARPTTGGRGFTRRGGGEGFERWEFWWEHNKEPFLNLKARMDASTVMSDTSGFFVGRGNKEEAVNSNRPTAAYVKATIMPKIVKLLLEEKHPDIVDSAAVALGRMTRSDDGKEAIDALVQTLSHNEKTAREAATLGLGVLGSPDAFETLLHILSDDQEGRRLTNAATGVEDLVRAFSAVSLGMLRDARAVEPLKAVVNDERLRSQLDLKAMAIVALGLAPRETHEDVSQFLVGLMESNLNRIVRAQAPISLGRLHSQTEGGSSAAVALLNKVVSLFESDKTDIDLARSLAICIGQLASIEDTEAIESLQSAVQRSNDDQTRHYSIMALAEIGGRDANPDAHAEMHSKLENFFLGELAKPKRISHQPYGALGLAVYSRNDNLQGAKNRAGEKIRETFMSTNNPSYQGAMAVALGLLNYKVSEDDLWAKFEDSNDQPLRGYIAVSLGLMNASSDKADVMRKLIQKKGLEAKFRLQLARSLGLMSDSKAVTTLVEYLQSAETLAESSSSAQALGLIGDKNAIDPLLNIAENPSKQDLQRGFAAVALGIIAEKHDLPWNTVFAVNSNYRAKVPALSEILDIL